MKIIFSYDRLNQAMMADFSVRLRLEAEGTEDEVNRIIKKFKPVQDYLLSEGEST